MQYTHIKYGIFIKRVNRFIAHVLVDGVEQVVHVKNTGRCRELFIPGVPVILESSDKPERKTKYSLIAVYKQDRLINVDSQVPNQVVYEALAAGAISGIKPIGRLKKEVVYGSSRFDLCFESGGQRCFMEVKGVTLKASGVAMFPDAPTTRGTKHIYEMIDCVQRGYGGYIFFLIQMQGADYFTTNNVMDPDFASALKKAANHGVNILAYDSLVSPDAIVLQDQVEVRI